MQNELAQLQRKLREKQMEFESKKHEVGRVYLGLYFVVEGNCETSQQSANMPEEKLKYH